MVCHTQNVDKKIMAFNIASMEAQKFTDSVIKYNISSMKYWNNEVIIKSSQINISAYLYYTNIYTSNCVQLQFENIQIFKYFPLKHK